MIDIPTKATKVANENAKVAIATATNEVVETTVEIRKPKVDANGRAYGTGRRKDAAARVWIKPGSGKIVVNGNPVSDYFKRPVLQMIINQPFEATNNSKKFDVFCTVKGGGLSGQAGAVRHGISRALDNFNPEVNHVTLRQEGYLTRDSRVVERKKFGRKKARKSFQFSKR
jgi:small subunit ribosomal protein S9